MPIFTTMGNTGRYSLKAVSIKNFIKIHNSRDCGKFKLFEDKSIAI